MTDNEFIKALVDLHRRILNSKFAEQVTESEIMGLVNAIVIINRQNAEIKRLQSVNADMHESLRLAAEANKDMQAEVERLSNFVSEEKCYEIAREMIPQFVRQARAEAIKEFAERLISMCDKPNWCVWLSEIEDLVEEMTEEKI